MVSFIKPYRQDPFVGHLATPVTTSAFTRAYLRLLPAYRPGLTPFSRGSEIGFAHGYFLVGPFYTYGPLRSVEFSLNSLSVGVLAALALVFILTVALSIYGRVTYDVYDNALLMKLVRQKLSSESTNSVPQVKRTSELDSIFGWQKFSEGFFSGGLFGAVVAGIGIALYSTYV
jgi:photosystem I subunit 11